MNKKNTPYTFRGRLSKSSLEEQLAGMVEETLAPIVLRPIL
jgi:hypothetical protein